MEAEEKLTRSRKEREESGEARKADGVPSGAVIQRCTTGPAPPFLCAIAPLRDSLNCIAPAENLVMKADVLEHLRRNHELCQLPGGREGVRVLVQYAGPVPATTRRDRQVWLEKRFTELASELGELGVQIHANQVSGSAQTVTAIVPVDQYDRADAQLSHWGCRAIVDYRDQVAW